MPDYNNDGKIDKFDREMEEIFLEEDEKLWQDPGNGRTAKTDGMAVIIVVAIMAILGIIICNRLGIH